MGGEDRTYFSGDWLCDEQARGADDAYVLLRAYEGIETYRWSGGVEFIASRAVVDAIVADNARLYPEVLSDGEVAEMDRFRWDGAVLVQMAVDGEEYRHEPQDEHGNYRVGFGWTWAPVDEGDVVRERVNADGTVTKEETESEEQERRYDAASADLVLPLTEEQARVLDAWLGHAADEEHDNTQHEGDDFLGEQFGIAGMAATLAEVRGVLNAAALS